MKDGNKKSTPRRVVIYALLLAAAIAGGIAAKAFDFRELAAVFTVNGTALLKLALLVFGILLAENLIVLVLGISLAVYYLSFGIFYSEDTFLVSTLGKKSDSYRYSQIVSQKLYLITGGNIVVELTMDTGSTVSLQSTMDGVYPFLDAAFSAWCRQKGIREADCPFHDPSKSWWFPHEEE